MRYKIASSAIAVLLIATPVFAQKSVPILTQTLRTTTPTTVITGQPLRQTYLVKFIDLSHRGEEIIIKKEDLDLKFIGDFEVLSFKIDYETKQGQFLEHRWYLNYTLRIINPEKGPKKMTSFVIPWKLKKTGQQENDPSIQTNYDLKTEDVHLNYVSTIPEKDPYLIIRDQVDFGTFKMSGLILKYVSWFLAIVPMGLWLVLFVQRLRTSGSRSREDGVEVVQINDPVTDVTKISKRKALRNLHRGIRKLSNAQDPLADHQSISDILVAINVYVRERAGLGVGTTPLEMVTAISSNKKLGSLQKPLLALAEKANEYQGHIEGGFRELYVESEAKELRKLLTNIGWYNRLLRRR